MLFFVFLQCIRQLLRCFTLRIRMPDISIFSHRECVNRSLFFQLFYIFCNFFRWQCSKLRKLCTGNQSIAVCFRMQCDNICGGTRFLSFQFFNDIVLESALNLRIRLQDHASTDRLHRWIEANNKFVSSSDCNLFFQAKLYITTLTRSDFFLVKKNCTT